MLYLVKITLFYFGAKRASEDIFSDDLPTVSIIVAARNEEHNIGVCLESLSRIDYPQDRFEIIIINDQSTDGTALVVESYRNVIPNLKVMTTVGSVHNLRGKANAMSQAIEKSSGEIICTTDADCTVSPDWVRNIVRRYTPEVGCICGFTMIKSVDIFTGIQALDWAYLLTIASAGVGWKLPLSAVGNNMSFRRKAYNDVGGYKRVGFSVTEDFALFKAISYDSPWRVRYPVTADTLVWSEPCANLKELYHQKKRWGNGGLDIHPAGFAIMSIGWLMSLAILLTPFLGVSLPVWLACVTGKFLSDAWLLSLSMRTLHLGKLMKYFFWYEIYYLVYVTLLPFIVFFGGKVVWKGRKL